MKPKERKHLKSGFTTGAAAAAATKGALQLLVGKRTPRKVEITFLNGEKREILIDSISREMPNRAVCTIVKDAGDDPDITHKAVIGARVELFFDKGSTVSEGTPCIDVSGGVGVGTVTKPGLEIPPGEPAINPGPRTMIRQEALDVLASAGQSGIKRIHVQVFVPQGVRLAKLTLNARLGILGGLSILGTTGIVRPMSHAAYIATIDAALSVARAAGVDQVFLTTGRRSERFARNKWPERPAEAFVQIGDYFRKTLHASVRHGFDRVMLCVFFGKAVKMAQGVPHTHAAKSRLTLEQLSTWTLEESGSMELARRVRQANTARHAFDILKDRHSSAIERVGREMVGAAKGYAGDACQVGGVIFDYEGRVVFDSRVVV